MTREEFLATIDERNALRAPAHVPLIDTPSALATWEVFRKAEAYDRFFQAHVKLHTQHLRQVPKNDDVALCTPAFGANTAPKSTSNGLRCWKMDHGKDGR